MKRIFLSAATVVGLGMGAAFAQGLPAGTTPPEYGSKAFTDQTHQNKSFLSELFGHSKNNQVEPDQKSNAAKGG